MKIKELYVENFGKLSKYRKTFSDGLNSFVEDNGYGKTTLSVFIKTMLYGFDETRRQSLDDNERKKYTPWQNGAFGGWLIFEINGKTYRIERSFKSKSSEDSFTLYDLDTGAVSTDYSESLGEEIFGIDADGFERTVFLSEKNLCGKNTNQSISAKLSNLVGTDGDIGGFDSAIKLLDDRRKFYQKRGGAGEIQDIRRELTEIEEEIRILESKKAAASLIEKEIADSKAKIQAIKLKKEIILADERKRMIEAEKRGYEIQYAQLIGALKTDEKRESELTEFFSKKLPTNYEMSVIANADGESKRLRSEINSIGENEELATLKKFFKTPTSAEECEQMTVLAKRVSESKASFYSSPLEELKSPFAYEPSEREIEEHFNFISNKKADIKHGSIFVFLVGILLSICGSILGLLSHAALYSVAIIGFLLTIVGIIAVLGTKSKQNSVSNNQKTQDFIDAVYGKKRYFNSEIEALFAIRSDFEKFKIDKKKYDELSSERTRIQEQSLRFEREVREFISGFPENPGLTLEESTLEILRMRRRYDLLSEYEKEREQHLSVFRAKLEEYEELLSSFLKNFPTVSSDPIEEIRRNMAEYEVLRSSLSRRRAEAERFADSHGIDRVPKNIGEALAASRADSFDLTAVNDELLAAEKEKSRLEADYSATVRDIDKIEELEERLIEKSEQADLFENNLWVITKAKELLAKSKDSMTARYLDSTKAGFEKYVSLIDDEVGDFTIDTAFTVTKSELGKSRQAEAYSRGTRDLHALAMRLALIDALYENEKPPIILDDPFISFDDTRAERATSILKKLSLNRQIFYFTCSKSRKVK